MAAASYRVLRAYADDAADIARIEQACFKTPWSFEAIYDDVAGKANTAYFVAKDNDGKTVGFGGMYAMVSEAHITNIAVLPGYRQKGIGGMLLSAMLKHAEQLRCEGATLEVRISNTAAIRMYERFGFQIEGQRKAYYADNRENAYIMWLWFR